MCQRTLLIALAVAVLIAVTGTVVVQQPRSQYEIRSGAIEITDGEPKNADDFRGQNGCGD